MITAMPLPFAADALVPHLSAESFNYHHGKHFQAYIKTTNDLIAATPAATHDLETIVSDAANAALFNAAGQVWNHGFFWASLSPPTPARPTGELAAAIDTAFGSFDAMAKAFVAAGTAEFGSGWVWLFSGTDGKLAIAATHDAMPIWAEQPATPLLVCDLWEHAYYLDWRNDRGAFLHAFITSLANWRLAQDQYAIAASDAAGWRYPVEPVPVTA
jgi:Fe-Mn family superoxide dismutase